jgi:hypothetical protein
MNLHPRDVLSALLAQHPTPFGLVHAGLDYAIQETCSMWVDKRPLRMVHPNVFAGDVRQALLCFLDCPEFGATGMRAEPGPNCSVVLSDEHGGQVTVRKHPRDYLTGKFIDSVEYPAMTLWGVDYSTWPWQPYILWTPDLKMQALEKASLAAVHGMDDPKKTELYDQLSLPPAIIPAGAAPSPDETSEEEDWSDEFGEEDSGSGDSA